MFRLCLAILLFAGGLAWLQAAAEERPAGREEGPPDTVMLLVQKEAEERAVPAPGEEVGFKIRLKNGGNSVLRQVTVEDSTNGVNWAFPATAEIPTELAAGAEWEYRYVLPVLGQAGDLFTNLVVVSAKDVSGEDVFSRAQVIVKIIAEEVPVPTLRLKVEKEAEPDEVMEPGGPVQFTVKLENEGDSALTIKSLADEANGVAQELPADFILPETLAAGAEWAGSYTLPVMGGAGKVFVNVVTVKATDAAGMEIVARATSHVRIKLAERPETLRLKVEKSAFPNTVNAPGGEVAFKLTLKNQSTEALTLTSVEDKTNGVPWGEFSEKLTLPTVLAPGTEWEGRYTNSVEGPAGSVFTNEFLVLAADAAGKVVRGYDSALVWIRSERGDEKPPVIVPAATLGDRVWNDLNRDGLQSPDEPGLANVTIQLMARERNQVLAEAISDQEGKYRFAGDYPSLVYLKVTRPEGYALTLRRRGEDRALDSDIDPATGKSPCIDLSQAEIEGESVDHATLWDIGFIARENEEAAPGVAGPGFWREEHTVWPVNTLVIGGKEYRKDEAIALMRSGSDKSMTLFSALAAALLNKAGGAQSGCIDQAIAAAQAWLTEQAPGSNVKGNREAWANGGEAILKQLESYNEGGMCAPKMSESRKPVSLRSALLATEKGKGFQLRIDAERGRALLLQRSTNGTEWVDVEKLENLYGVSEAIQAETSNDRAMFYRVVYPEGPAQINDSAPQSRGPFRQLSNGETIELSPLLYEGDLVVNGNANTISGKVEEGTLGTVIAGDLVLRGNGNKVSNLRVLGKLVLQGRDNQLENIEYETEVIEPETE